VLADVRNNQLEDMLSKMLGNFPDSFVSFKRRDTIEPISKPKGLPPDISKKAQKVNNNGEEASYLTLREIESYDWSQIIGNYNYINFKDYKTYKETKEQPNSTSHSGGRKEVMISTSEADEFLEKPYKMSSLNDYFVKISWTNTMKEQLGEEWWQFVEGLKKLSTNPDHVRIVFSFCS